MTSSRGRSRESSVVILWTLLLIVAGISSATHLHPPHPPWAIAYLLINGAIHALAIASALYFAASILSRWLDLRWWRLLTSLLAAATVMFVAIDATVYGLLGLHIDRNTFGNILEPQGLTTLGISAKDILLAAAITALVGVTSWLTLRNPPRARRAVMVFLLLGALDTSFSVANALVRFWGVQPVLGLSEAMPLAWSPRGEELLSNLLGRQPTAIDDDLQFPSPTLLEPEYRELRSSRLPDKASRRPDILLITVESLRADALVDMPDLTQWAKGALSSQRHYASGNCTFLSVFSLLTGLESPFWTAHETSRAPRGLSAFAALGYQIYLTESAALNFGMVDKVLPPGAVHLIHRSTELDPLQRDELNTQWTIEWISASHRQPSLAVLFLDATHWPYWSTGEATRSVGLGDSWLLRHQLPAIRARYRKSVQEADRRIGQVLRAVQRAGKEDSLVVALVGDHGEAFLEHGVFSHGSRLDEEQLRIPWVLKLPGMAPGTIAAPSFQHDVLPTLLGYLGAEPLVKGPGQGVDKLSNEERFAPPMAGSCGISWPTGFAAFWDDKKILLQIDKKGTHFVGVVGPGDVQFAQRSPSQDMVRILELENRAFRTLLAVSEK